MPRIVYITNAMASTLNSSYEISRRLTDSGHEVIYVSHADIKEQVCQYGYRFVQLIEDQKILREFQERIGATSKHNFMTSVVRRLRLGREYFQRSAQQREIEQTIESLSPDFLLIDIECHFAILACSQLGIPMALPIVWHNIYRNWGVPPLHSRRIYSPEFLSRLRSCIDWIYLLASRRLSHFFLPPRTAILRRLFQPIRYDGNIRFELQEVAKARGIKLSKFTDWSQWLRPHLYPELDILCLNASEFDFPCQPSERVRYVGPAVFEQRNEVIDNREAASWEAFRVEAIESGNKIVYCTLGTFWSANERFLQKLIAVFTQQTNWSLVLGLGGKLDPKALGSMPKNVLAMNFAPQIEVLRSASAAISHGGITSINECLFFEVPILCCSTGHVDQDGCSARVQYHGLGIQVDMNKATTEDLKLRLEQVLNNEEIRTNVKKMSQVIRGYRERRVIETFVESQLAQ